MRILKDEKIIRALKCSNCGSDMTLRADGSASLVCLGARTHCFDISSSGYVNFARPGQSGGGDSPSAVKARSAFLNGGYYRPIADALCDVVSKYTANRDGIVVDAGCGEGYYTSLIAESGVSVFGADISKFAVEAGAKRVKRSGIENAFFGVASIFELPLKDGCASALVNIFAPCDEREYLRILEDGGVLIVAYAGEDHLMGLKRILYDHAYANDGKRADLPSSMEEIEQRRVRFTVECNDNETIMDLFSMTPYYWRTSPEDAQKLRQTDSLTTEADVIISVYKK